MYLCAATSSTISVLHFPCYTGDLSPSGFSAFPPWESTVNDLGHEQSPHTNTTIKKAVPAYARVVVDQVPTRLITTCPKINMPN
jgi:hypothetical protein